jgi:2-polyprenyl-3-methyl-5-hydroxy-6-metoxy-1,4-benzoquinol methylase
MSVSIKKFLFRRIKFYFNLIRNPEIIFPIITGIKNEPSECPLCCNKSHQHYYYRNLYFHKFKVKKNTHALGSSFKAYLASCDLCDFTYFYPRPSQHFLNDFYTSGAQRGNRPDEDELFNLNGYVNRCDMSQVLSFLTERGINLSDYAGKMVLEVGSGYSSFIPFAKKYKLNIVANDISDDALNFTKRVFGIPVIKSMISDIPKQYNNNFSIIYSKDSLEHHIDPMATLKRIFDLLLPNGLLILIVPNLRSKSFATVNTAHRYFSFPQHLNYFSPRSLMKALHALGAEASYATYTSIAEISYSMGSSIEWGEHDGHAEELNLFSRNDEHERIVILARKG